MSSKEGDVRESIADENALAIGDGCGSFLQSYSEGNVDVGGPIVPESAVASLVLTSGHFEPPCPPDEKNRVRELYIHCFSVMLIAQDINIAS